MTLRCSVESIEALDVPRGTAARIAAWTEVLDRWQRASRLVGWRRWRDLLSEGIADALAVGPLLDAPPEGPWVDLGSGNGLPALILAALHPEQEIHLVESRRKRCAFLRAAVLAMDLGAVRVHHARSEELLLRPDRPRPMLLLARAFVPPPELPGHAERWGAPWLLVSSSRARLPPEGWPDGWGLHVERSGCPSPERRHLLLHRGG